MVVKKNSKKNLNKTKNLNKKRNSKNFPQNWDATRVLEYKRWTKLLFACGGQNRKEHSQNFPTCGVLESLTRASRKKMGLLQNMHN
jgi:hypothetical protein